MKQRSDALLKEIHRALKRISGPSTQNTEVRVEDLIPGAYADFAATIFAEFARPALTTKESDVAEAVWLAVNGTSGKLRFPAGADAAALSGAVR